MFARGNNKDGKREADNPLKAKGWMENTIIAS